MCIKRITIIYLKFFYLHFCKQLFFKIVPLKIFDKIHFSISVIYFTSFLRFIFIMILEQSGKWYSNHLRENVGNTLERSIQVDFFGFGQNFDGFLVAKANHAAVYECRVSFYWARFVKQQERFFKKKIFSN